MGSVCFSKIFGGLKNSHGTPTPIDSDSNFGVAFRVLLGHGNSVFLRE